MYETAVPARDPAHLLRFVAGDDAAGFHDAVSRAGAAIGRRTLWHVNSTAEGGGVAELLHATLGYLGGSGLTVRRLILEGDPGFFRITKRIHNRLHGDVGDGGDLGAQERARYEEVMRQGAAQVLGLVGAGDVVVVHDPQPAGLIPVLVGAGARVVWTCHVGVDLPNDVARSAWDFLRPWVEAADAAVFSRAAYVWEGLDAGAIAVIPPCIDPLATKNVELPPERRDTILAIAGLVEGTPGAPGPDPHGRVIRRAELVETATVPATARLVTQVSRWDRLKDPGGVLRGFAGDPTLSEAHLVLAGPAPSSVADDPEAEAVWAELRDAWRSQPSRIRERIHLANLPTDDAEENALIVNALQRRADVVVQKSLAEGFGLTVTEAMWKRRPVVAGRVGGVRDQIDDGVHGVLVDPRDLAAFGAAVHGLLADPDRAAALGAAAHERVRERFLPLHYLAANLEVIAALGAA